MSALVGLSRHRPRLVLRRFLARSRDRQLDRKNKAVSEHKHTWSTVAHLDGCHAYHWTYSCPCGATRKNGAERAFADEDGMSFAMWFEESCERCNELAAGAEPKEWDEITEAVS